MHYSLSVMKLVLGPLTCHLPGHYIRRRWGTLQEIGRGLLRVRAVGGMRYGLLSLYLLTVPSPSPQ